MLFKWLILSPKNIRRKRRRFGDIQTKRRKAAKSAVPRSLRMQLVDSAAVEIIALYSD
jgi:hypothetical protein